MASGTPPAPLSAAVVRPGRLTANSTAASATCAAEGDAVSVGVAELEGDTFASRLEDGDDVMLLVESGVTLGDEVLACV